MSPTELGWLSSSSIPLVVGPVTEPEGLEFATSEVWGLKLARVTFAGAVDLVEQLIVRRVPSFFITANLHYARLSHEDPRLSAVNSAAAFSLADGMPLVWWSRRIGQPLPERVTGSDLTKMLCCRAAERGWKVWLLGAGPGIAAAAATVLVERYPGLQIVGIESPELGRMSDQDRDDLIGRIRRARPDLLLAALGQPKGELWLHRHCQALGVPACVQVGATLDFIAGRVRRAPRWMQRLGLEWLYRVFGEPRRLVGRYFHDGLFLLRQAFKARVRS